MEDGSINDGTVATDITKVVCDYPLSEGYYIILCALSKCILI